MRHARSIDRRPVYTHIRGTDSSRRTAARSGSRSNKTGPEPLGAGGTGTPTVNGATVAEGETARTTSVDCSMGKIPVITGSAARAIDTSSTEEGSSS